VGGRLIRTLGFVALAAPGAGCTGVDPCEDVAALLRKCCEKGPAEHKKACEARAAELEEDGNSEACDRALDEGEFAGCDT
jgi:hypothetical protein